MTARVLGPMALSISFGSMGQDQFRDFFNLALDVVVTEVIPGTDKASLMRELEEMLGEPIQWITEK